MGGQQQMYVLVMQLPLRGVLKSGGMVFVLKTATTSSQTEKCVPALPVHSGALPRLILSACGLRALGMRRHAALWICARRWLKDAGTEKDFFLGRFRGWCLRLCWTALCTISCCPPARFCALQCSFSVYAKRVRPQICRSCPS